jgi:hypothetical protein
MSGGIVTLHVGTVPAPGPVEPSPQPPGHVPPGQEP